MLKKLSILLFSIFVISQTSAQNKKIITLSWDKVVDYSLSDNLMLKSKMLEYDAQQLEVYRSYTNFLPTITYTGAMTKNMELPVFVFMGQSVQIGSKYSFQHSLDFSLPLFTGGSRLFNVLIQSNLKKSLSEELKGQESQTVLTALQSYYGIILSEELSETAGEAVRVAKENLDQVEIFYNNGSATELDLQRAKAQYYSTLPQYEAASSNRMLSYQRLKTILNISLEDSLEISDSLYSKDFLNEYNVSSLQEMKNLALERRNDIKSMQHRYDATETAEYVSLGKFAPTISLSGNIAHQAQMDDSKVMWDDYIRSKSLTLAVQWPLFEGGRRLIDYQLSKIQTEQVEYALSQTKDGALLEVEEKYSLYKQAVKSLNSLEQAMLLSKESMRISSIMYNNGLSTQIDVLNSQLLYTKSKADYLQGIYNYNISQLELLKAAGLMDKVWK